MDYLQIGDNWVIKVPLGMNMMELSRYRFTGAELAIIALLAAGTTATVVSQVQQGQSAKTQANFQSKIAARNAEQALEEAEGKRQSAAEAAIQAERRGKAIKASQVAGFAKSGVELRGSPLSVLVETAQDIEADKLTLLREGAIAGATDEFRAGILQAEGSAAKARGSAAKRASVLSGIGTAATGAGNIGFRQQELNK
jgi:hypothetical protein